MRGISKNTSSEIRCLSKSSAYLKERSFIKYASIIF